MILEKETVSNNIYEKHQVLQLGVFCIYFNILLTDTTEHCIIIARICLLMVAKICLLEKGEAICT